jgi:3-oxoadipate enol-lactonase
MAELRLTWSHRTAGRPDAPPVVLLHAIATSSEMWLGQMDAWSQRYRCIAVDLPGHGQTPPDPQIESIDDYADALMRQIDDPRVSIVGLSLGGMITQACAIRHADRVDRVVIANSLFQTPAVGVQAWQGRLHTAENEGMASQSADTLARWFTPSFRAANPQVIDHIRSLIESTDLEGYRTAVRAIQRLNYADALSTIRGPVLVVTGSEDPVATPAVATALAAKIPGAHLQVLVGAAHLSNIEKPHEFKELVADFLDGKRTVAGV